MRQHWKKILALGLSAALLLTGGWFVWNKTFFGGKDGASAALAFPAPEPVKYDPPEPNPPPVQGYLPDPVSFAVDEETGLEFVRGIIVVYFERGST